MKYLFALLSGAIIIFFILFFTNHINLKDTDSTNMITSPTAIIDEKEVNTAEYKNCIVLQRANMNNPSYTTLLNDRSEVKCDLNGSDVTLFEVLDKPGFENSKNSIYRFWKEDGVYKALLVDQNGAGSGEGNGKIILLEKGGYKLISCFYYVPESFTSSINDPLSTKEKETISKSLLNPTNTYCSNFTLNSYLK